MAIEGFFQCLEAIISSSVSWYYCAIVSEWYLKSRNQWIKVSIIFCTNASWHIVTLARFSSTFTVGSTSTVATGLPWNVQNPSNSFPATDQLENVRKIMAHELEENKLCFEHTLRKVLIFHSHWILFAFKSHAVQIKFFKRHISPSSRAYFMWMTSYSLRRFAPFSQIHIELNSAHHTYAGNFIFQYKANF